MASGKMGDLLQRVKEQEQARDKNMKAGVVLTPEPHSAGHTIKALTATWLTPQQLGNREAGERAAVISSEGASWAPPATSHSAVSLNHAGMKVAKQLNSHRTPTGGSGSNHLNCDRLSET